MFYDNEFLNQYECVASFEVGEGYDFDTTVILKKDGNFFWAYDSGCSCPTPFEGYNHEGMLERLNSSSRWDDSWKAFESHVNNLYGGTRTEKASFLDEVESIIGR
jgi:hypothetical protein